MTKGEKNRDMFMLMKITEPLVSLGEDAWHWDGRSMDGQEKIIVELTVPEGTQKNLKEMHANDANDGVTLGALESMIFNMLIREGLSSIVEILRKHALGLIRDGMNKKERGAMNGDQRAAFDDFVEGINAIINDVKT